MTTTPNVQRVSGFALDESDRLEIATRLMAGMIAGNVNLGQWTAMAVSAFRAADAVIAEAMRLHNEWQEKTP